MAALGVALLISGHASAAGIWLIGTAVLLPILLYLQFSRALSKLWNRIPSANAQHTVVVGQDGIKVSISYPGGSAESFTDWNLFATSEEHRDYFSLRGTKKQLRSLLIPKRAFRDATELSRFIFLLQENTAFRHARL